MWRRLPAFLLPVGLPLLIFLILAVCDEHNIIMEDQFITLRYGRNLAEGNGLVFNLGERVEGFSNPLWVLMMAPAFIADVNVLAYNRLLCLLLAFAHFPLICLIMKKHLPPGSSRGAYLIAPVLLALSFPFLFWTKSGLETVLASLLTLGGCGLLMSGRFFSSSCLFGLLAVTRPEGAMYLVVPFVFLAFSGYRRDAKKYLRALGPGICVFMLYEIFRIGYFGELLPSSFYAKVQVRSAGQKLEGLRYYLEWAASMWGIVLAAALGLLVRFRAEFSRFLILFAALALNAFFVVAAGGDYMPHSRFVVPVIPLAAVAAGAGYAALFRAFPPSVHGKFRGAAATVLTALMIWFHPGTWRGIKSIAYAAGNPSDLPVPSLSLGRRWADLWLAKRKQPNRFVGEWLRDNLPDGVTVATAQCGIISYVSGLKFIDIFGLMTPEMAKMPLCERARTILERKTEYILLAFSIHYSMPTFVPCIFSERKFIENYCLEKVFVSLNYNRGSIGYLLFRRGAPSGEDCVEIPYLESDESVFDWLSSSMRNPRLIAAWGYDYDIFR